MNRVCRITRESHMHRLRHRFPVVWLTLLVGLLGGCSTPLPGHDAAPPSQYLLEWQPAAAAPTAPAGAPVLLLNAPRAAAGFGSSDMLYQGETHRLGAFRRHRWADAPARMLEPLLLRALEHSGLFSAVAAPGAAVRGELRLDTELMELLLDTRGARHSVSLRLRAALIDQASGRLLATREFAIDEPAADATPYAGVQAANRAVARLMTGLRAFLARQLAERHPATAQP